MNILDPKFIAAWMLHQETSWTSDRLNSMLDPEDFLKFILAVLERDKDELTDTVMQNLAAGPLEDFLVRHGAQYIDRVETLARENAKFRECLGGVWQNSMPDEIWQRVEAVRGEVW